MKQRLSHSSVRLYSQCGRKYKLRYIDGYRPKVTSGALLFGSALDGALNVLLETKDLTQAIKVFDKTFHFNFINEIGTYLPDSTLITYAKSDFDPDLLKSEDYKKFSDKQYEYNIHQDKSLEDAYAFLINQKEEVGFSNLSDNEKKLLNLANWLCLYRKGLIMLEGYNSKVLPKIKNVLAVQKQIELENQEQDRLVGYIDMILQMDDGKRYVMDNKTSTKEYELDSPSHSQQLILYYHATKDEYQLDGAGFIVMYKLILKNKTKRCSVCNNDGTGKRHKSCDAEINSKRCGGEWIETINPEANIQIITNSIPQAAEDLVLETFDEANLGIKNETFSPNLQACVQGPIICEYYNKCWRGNDTDLIKKNV
jgi:hypothetical protein